MKRALIITSFLFVSLLGHSATITVDDDGPADYSTIQAAIDAAEPNDVVVLQTGTYTGDGNRDIDFLGKTITVRSSDPYDPDIVESTIIDCQGTEAESHRGFYFHDEISNCIIKGITVCNGYVSGDYYWESHGGAIFCNGSNPAISYCRFINNTASCGGALYLRDCNIKLSNCEISGNISHDLGGGIFSDESNVSFDHCIISENNAGSGGAGGYSTGCFDFKDCTIESNWREGIRATTVNLDNCIVRNNIVCGLKIIYGIIENSVFYGNWAPEFGAGILIGGCDGGPPDPLITNCTFFNNTAEEGAGAVASAGGRGCDPHFNNCIVWGNEPADDPGIDYFITSKCGVPTAHIEYSILQYDWTLSSGLIVENSTVVDPLFADPNNGDFHLMSQEGRWDPVGEGWVVDASHSPGIDAGDPNDPRWINETSPNGARINVGAYGGTWEASLSECVKHTAPFYDDWVAFDKPECWCYSHQCKGDTSGLQCHKSGCWYVGTTDLDVLLSAWQRYEEYDSIDGEVNLYWNIPLICADFDHKPQSDKVGTWRVGTEDLNILLANWQIFDPGVEECSGTYNNFYILPTY